MSGFDYRLFPVNDVPVAGAMELLPDMRDRGVPPHWSGYVAVDDVDAATARVARLGGAVRLEPTDIPGVGRFSVIADPHGVVIMPFRGQGEALAVGMARLGHVGWRELMAGDLDGAFPFYEALFGWTRAGAVSLGAMGTYQLFACAGVTIGGMMTKPPQVPHVFWRYYVRVDGIDATAERVSDGGGTLVHGPSAVAGGDWVVQAIDPQGAHFALVSAMR